jgi:urea carboxylase-associated protein 1
MTPAIDEIVRPGEPWTAVLGAGARLRITDVEGTQSADTLFYSAADAGERYSSADTIRAQANIFLTTGSVLVSNRGRPLLHIVEDTCGRHDTVGGACSAESNVCRFGHQTRFMHNCRDNFLVGLARHGLGKRDLVPNINFFMHVPVTAAGRLDIVDGISRPGDHVDLVADQDVLVVISNCPQLNNPCNGWNPTPLGVTVWVPSADRISS